MKKKALTLVVLTLTLLVFCLENIVYAQTILLDSFESGSIRVVQSDQTDPQHRYLWNQFVDAWAGNAEPGIATIATSPTHDGNYSLKVTSTGIGSAGIGNIYLEFYPNNGITWQWMRNYVQQPQNWKFNTYNRMRFWVKIPSTYTSQQSPGDFNFNVGTYIRKSNGSSYSAEDGGNHYYHYLNLKYSGQWEQVIIDTHPNHTRGGNGGTEWGNQLHPTGEAGYNYFDLLTRFYFQGNYQLNSYPSDYYLDGFELYQETNPENIDQIYSLHGVYIPSTNKLTVGWSRNKNENSVAHEVRYAFQSVFQVGWANALPAPNGTVTPPGWQGYNGMEWSTQALNMSGHSVVYIAIKPQNSNAFRQIAIPISSSSNLSQPSAPTDLQIRNMSQ